MLRISRFGGIITDASPYAIPPGGATQQYNLTCSVPGQLTSRSGMQLAVPERAAPAEYVITQLFTAPGGVGRGDKLVMVASDGSVTLTPSIS